MAGSPPKNQSPLRRGGRFVSPIKSSPSRISKTPDDRKKESFAAGCIICKTKDSPKFYHRDIGLLSHLRAKGVEFHFATDARHKEASLCKTCWVWLDRTHPHRYLRSNQEETQDLSVEIINDVIPRGDGLINDPESASDPPVILEKTTNSTGTQTALCSLSPELLDNLDFKSGALKLADAKFEGQMPFTAELDEFIEHLDSCDQLATKTAVVGRY
ncbi:hypothetical protein DFS34DRAFT_455717 [Phlyctochytrium arcticum]|nr:hypothetical protein DFS34DRAFT_455717 [Phlyctochytrium arcticum]